MNALCTFVYRWPMRFLCVSLFFMATGLLAQPGWHPLEFSFVLEHHGVEVPAKDLRDGKEFAFEAAGERARLFSYSGSRFSTLRFPEELSDITRHRDTLWLRIEHRREGRMEIGFPPRRGARTLQPYSTDFVVVPFSAGRALVTDLPKELRVTGVMHGLGLMWQTRHNYEPSVHCGCDTLRNALTGLQPAMDLTLRCRTQLRDGMEQTELVFTSPGSAYRPALEMTIRGTIGDGLWPLDTLVFSPTRFVMSGGRPLEPDNAGPRDEVVGVHTAGTWFRIAPVNPTPEEKVRFTWQWLGGGERLTVSHALEPAGGDTTDLVLTIRREPLEMDPRPQYRMKAVAYEVPALPLGIYRLRMVYADDPAMPVPRFPEAESFILRVADR